jgi:hypothetical protein
VKDPELVDLFLVGLVALVTVLSLEKYLEQTMDGV